uniref:Variant surface glycoprotein n=1 Tax=Trypanosoma brucei TaxID=5691 RepID=A0A1V0FZY8_9TRYP|nr:variant surface glycoprotein [Trypanosoma brucei]
MDASIKGNPKELLLSAACEAQIAAQQTPNKLTDITPEKLSTDSGVQAAIRQHNAAFKGVKDTSDSSQTTKLSEHVKKEYGETLEKFTEKFITNLNSKEISYMGPKRNNQRQTRRVSNFHCRSNSGKLLSLRHTSSSSSIIIRSRPQRRRQSRCSR